MANDPVQIIHDELGQTATVQRSSLHAWAKTGWHPSDPAEVISTDGNVADVLAEVGDDSTKAQAAIEVEKAGKNRSRLLTQLQTIADRSNQPDNGTDTEEQ
jgi:hypothetical protein